MSSQTPEPEAEVLADDADLIATAEPEPKTQWQLFRRRFFKHKLAVGSLVVLILMTVLCYGAPWFTSYPQDDQVFSRSLETPSTDHYFGTDDLGRDYFTEIIYAGRTSLRIGFTVAIICTFVGTVVGALAGYYGGWADQLLMRLTDMFLIVPALAILAVAREEFGSSPATISYILAGVLWMWVARVVRGQTLSIKEKEFVEGARAIGAPARRIILWHILPNCLGPIVVNATLQIGVAIILESTLSFLGFGVESSWGNLLNDHRGNYTHDQYLLYFPGLMILITVLCVNALGDGLRDALDPHSGTQ